MEYDTETHVNNIRMLATATDGDIYLGTRDGKVYVYDAALSRPKRKKCTARTYMPFVKMPQALFGWGVVATACMWTVKVHPPGR